MGESQTVPIGAMDTFIKVGTVTLMGFYSKCWILWSSTK